MSLVLLALSFSTQANVMPVLHSIEEVVLEAPYSCNGSYEKSAIFLSDHSKRRNSPDLLYNGSCNSRNFYIEASTAGDDFSLIADLGNVDLKEVTAAKAFNFKNVVGFDNTFTESANVIKGHVYAVLSTKSDKRSLVIYRVKDFTPNKSITFEYAVKSYAIQKTVEEVPGFSWGAQNY